LAGPAAAIFGPVKDWPSQNLKKIGWANYGWTINGWTINGWAEFLAGPIDDPAISPAIIPVKQNWPSQNMAQPKLGQQPNFGSAKKWKKLAQPKKWPSHYWPSQILE
jgi:hypothetical protein